MDGRKIDARGCWLWRGQIDRHGYGQISVGNLTKQAHRVSFEAFRGPIPDGLDIDHKCRVRHCVNPKHMEPVPRRVNILRGQGICGNNARKTHCKHGHEFTPENTLRHGNGRKCLTCARAAVRRYQARRRKSLK